jgi:outer membrane protein TolC
MTRIAVTVVATLLVLASPAHAQPAGPPPSVTLTLDDAVARGLAASHRLAEALARGDASTAVVGQRRAAARPQASLQGGYMRTNHVDEFGILLPTNELRIIYPDIPDNARTRLDLQWPIYTGGRLEALQRAAEAEAAASGLDVDAARADLRLEITRAYWALVTARESVRVLAESLERTSAHVRDVRNQLDAGLVPPNDVFTAEAQESRQRMLSVQAGATRDVANADLARLVGADPGAEIVPATPLDRAPVVDQRVDALVAQGLRTRPERLALEKRLGGFSQQQRAARAGARPTIGIGGGVDYARPNPRIFPRLGAWRESWDASVNVTWPLFDGGRTRAEVAQASALARAAQARLDEFDSVLAVEVRQRLSEITASHAAIDAADAALRAATEALRVVNDRFSAGVATSTDVLDAEVAVLQAGLDRTQALANARLAEARLNRTIGQ